MLNTLCFSSLGGNNATNTTNTIYNVHSNSSNTFVNVNVDFRDFGLVILVSQTFLLLGVQRRARFSNWVEFSLSRSGFSEQAWGFLLDQTENVYRQGTWVPRDFRKEHKAQKILLCNILLARVENLWQSSLDFALSDYHLFRSMKHFLKEKTWYNAKYFVYKPAGFYKKKGFENPATTKFRNSLKKNRKNEITFLSK